MFFHVFSTEKNMEKQRIHDCISDIAGGNPRLFPYFFPPGYQLLQLYIYIEIYILVIETTMDSY